MEYKNKKIRFRKIGGYYTSVREVYCNGKGIGLVVTEKGRSTFYSSKDKGTYQAKKITEAVKLYLQEKDGTIP